MGVVTCGDVPSHLDAEGYGADFLSQQWAHFTDGAERNLGRVERSDGRGLSRSGTGSGAKGVVATKLILCRWSS